MEIKSAFIDEFMPELKTGKAKSKSSTMAAKLKAALAAEEEAE